MVRLTVPLDKDEQLALIALSDNESRDPRRQAAVIIRKALEDVGLLKPKTLKREAANNDHN